MTALERPGIAHKIYEIFGTLTVVEDHLAHGTGSFTKINSPDLFSLREWLVTLKPIVCDGYFALTNPSAEHLFLTRLRTIASMESIEQLDEWCSKVNKAAVHLSRIMRLNDFPAGSITPKAVHDNVEHNTHKTLLSLINGDRVCSGFPLEVTLQQANGCNLRCRHCYQSVDQNFPLQTLGVGLAQKFVDSSITSSIEKLKLAGKGEPTMSPASQFILKSIEKNEKCETSVFSNATLSKQLMQISPLITQGYISFDGGSKESFELIRAGADFDKVINTLENMAPADRSKLSFNVVVTRLNIAELPGIVRISSRLGMRGVVFPQLVVHSYLPALRYIQFVPSDREIYTHAVNEAKAVAKELGVKITVGEFDSIVTVSEECKRTPDEIRSILNSIKPATYRRPKEEPFDELLKLFKAENLPDSALQSVFRALEEMHDQIFPPDVAIDQDILPACGWPWTDAYVNADGTISPCCGPLHNTPLGNLHQNSFEEIWNGPAYQRLRRQQITGEPFFQGCVDCTRGMRFSYLQRACQKITASPEQFESRSFRMPISIPSNIANLGVVRKVVENSDLENTTSVSNNKSCKQH